LGIWLHRLAVKSTASNSFKEEPSIEDTITTVKIAEKFENFINKKLLK